MKPLLRLCGAALVGAFTLLAAPAAQAQGGGRVNVGAPAWGPQVPYGTQYYYIPEIDGYYDLYAQQYIVFQDGYWVPLPQLYGYDPYQFHPVIVDYRGAQPWTRIDYYHQHYAYQPYCNYGPGRGYYSGGYGRPRYDVPRGGYYSNGRNSYNGWDRRDQHSPYPGNGYNPPRSLQPPRGPQPGGIGHPDRGAPGPVGNGPVINGGPGRGGPAGPVGPRPGGHGRS